ncbi:MAG: hypothetical protein V3R64_06875, partial [Sphingomonadales bacterium]
FHPNQNNDLSLITDYCEKFLKGMQETHTYPIIPYIQTTNPETIPKEHKEIIEKLSTYYKNQVTKLEKEKESLKTKKPPSGNETKIDDEELEEIVEDLKKVINKLKK